MTLHLSQIFFTEARTFICHFLVQPTLNLAGATQTAPAVFTPAPQTARRGWFSSNTQMPASPSDHGGLRKFFRYL
jgi:hypothetical protein